MRAFTEDALSIGVVQSSRTIELHWRGRSHGRQPGQTLGLFLANAVDVAAETRATLELRFEELQYFNSATVSTIVQCLHTARARAVAVRVVYDGEREWQRLSFEPMLVFATDALVELCPVRPPAPARRLESQ
jgi:hypothetical protein